MSIESLSETTAEAVAPALPSEPLFSRELSWLAFNERVLAEAANPRQPLVDAQAALLARSGQVPERTIGSAMNLPRPL